MADKDHLPKKSNQQWSMSNNPMQQINDFFNGDPYNSILGSIDSFFQTHPFGRTSFPVDLYETPSEWVVKAELPGVKKEDIHIETMSDRIRIAVINQAETEETNDIDNYYRRERRMDTTERTIQLPYTVHRQKTKARYSNGILELRGPKYPKTRNTLDIE